MRIVVRPYTSEPGFNADFLRVRDFLIRVQDPLCRHGHFEWVRWEWGFSLPYLDETKLAQIGVWEDNGKIVALATYETVLGEAFFAYDPLYLHLRQELIEYALKHLAVTDKDGQRNLTMHLPESDAEFKKFAVEYGFTETDKLEHTSVIYRSSTPPEVILPAGFSIVSMAEENDLHKINRVLWRGFNHPGEPTEAEIPNRGKSQSGPDFRKDITLAVKAPDGSFVSYCGMWYRRDLDYAVVEPVATDPDYRRQGLGKAVVLEGVRRCFAEGAKTVYVGSGQQFYQDIGFSLLSTTRKWIKTW